MKDEFVLGFMSDDPEGLTPIDIVADLTGLTIEEVRSCSEVVTITDEDPRDLGLDDSWIHDVDMGAKS